MIDHPVSPATLALWVEDDLPPADAAEVAAHLANCAACRAEVDALRDSQAWLKEGEEPPFTAEDRAALRTTVLAQLPVRAASPVRIAVRTWGALLAAAAVLLVVVSPRFRREAPSPASPSRGPSRPAEPAPQPALPTNARRAFHPPKTRPSRPPEPARELASAPPGIRIELQSPDPTIRILWLPNLAAAPANPPDPSRTS